MKLLNYLLVFLPVSILAEFFHFGPLWVFFSSALAILPLAGIMGEATEDLGKRLGNTLGSLLSATFGNAAELILTISALRAGLSELVKATITGSIIGNILLILGLSIFVGGIKYHRQTFNQQAAGTNATMMAMAIIGLVLPAIFHQSGGGMGFAKTESLSLVVGFVLILTYAASLLFSLHTHKSLFAVEEKTGPAVTKTSWVRAAVMLLVSTVFLSIESELLVGSTEPVLEALGWSQLFVGIIIIPLVGNAAEHMTAVFMAAKNRMDLALGITVGSSTQIALFVAPLLLFISVAMGKPMTLIFNPFELSAIVASILIVNLISHDGESHWFEGLQLLAAYAVIAAGFFFI